MSKRFLTSGEAAEKTDIVTNPFVINHFVTKETLVSWDRFDPAPLAKYKDTDFVIDDDIVVAEDPELRLTDVVITNEPKTYPLPNYATIPMSRGFRIRFILESYQGLSNFPTGPILIGYGENSTQELFVVVADQVGIRIIINGQSAVNGQISGDHPILLMPRSTSYYGASFDIYGGQSGMEGLSNNISRGKANFNWTVNGTRGIILGGCHPPLVITSLEMTPLSYM